MTNRHLRRACVAGLMITWCAAAQDNLPGNLQMGRLGDFRLESGAVIRDCQAGYRTFGKLNAKRSNAILFPTWFTGTAQQLAALIGPGKLGSYDLLLWQAELHAIEAAADWKHGEYQGRPAAAMRTVADIHALALQTPRLRDRETSPRKFPEFLAATERDTMESFDTNNWYRQAQAMMGHDVSSPFGRDMRKAAEVVHARVLVVASLQDHMVTPWPGLDFAKLLKGRTLELDSECGHLAPGCEEAKVAAAIARLLEE